MGEERRRKRSKAEQEVRIQAGVCVCAFVCAQRARKEGLPSRGEEGATLQENGVLRLKRLDEEEVWKSRD